MKSCGENAPADQALLNATAGILHGLAAVSASPCLRRGSLLGGLWLASLNRAGSLARLGRGNHAHIVSSGLCAKPVIDVMVGVTSLADSEPARAFRAPCVLRYAALAARNDSASCGRGALRTRVGSSGVRRR